MSVLNGGRFGRTRPAGPPAGDGITSGTPTLTMNPPRLLIRSHIALGTEDFAGGADRLIINVASALSEGDWEVEVLCPKPRGEPARRDEWLTYNEFEYPTPESSFTRLYNTVRGAGTFRELTEAKDFDIVLDNVSHYPFYPAHFLRPEGCVNAVFMHTAFFGAAREHIGPIKGSVIDCIDRTLPYLCEPEIVCAGPSTEARINETSDYGETRVLRPCIDIDAFEFEFDPSSRTVSYLGRLGRRKNVSCLLKAWSAFEAARPGYSLIIAGTGSEEQRLKALAAKLGVQNVEFRGFVSEREKVRLYERSLLSVIPSRMEGYVTTGLEALAAGTPVVGADTYGINDYLTHRENGFLFSDNDPASLARVLEAITDDPEALEPVAKNGRRTAEKHSREAFGRRARQLFADLLVEHRSNR